MASACVNNVGIPPENFIDCSASYGWLAPRISLSRENNHDDQASNGVPNALPLNRLDPPEVSDLQVSDKDLYDFEFRLEDPVIMLPADELFSDGKLVPLLFPVSRPAEASSSSSRAPSAVRASATLESCRTKEAVEIDPFLFSPKAPRCSSRWKELLGLKKLSLNANTSKADINNIPSSHSAGINNGSKSRRLFLHRSSKSSCSSIESSLNIPLLKDLDSHPVTKSSRRSLSLCSSSCQEHDDLPRLSLDSDKPALKQSITSHYSRNPNLSSSNPPPRVRLLKQRAIIPSENQASARVGRSPVRRTPDSSTVTLRGVSMDSPRMNSSGKVIFQGLERSSSSPSTLNGGPPNNKQRGMERSYSANVRVTPFLNVPVGSLSKSSVFGFQLFPTTPQKRGDGSGSYSSSMGGVSRGQQQQQHQVSGSYSSSMGGVNRGQQQQHQVSGRNRN